MHVLRLGRLRVVDLAFQYHTTFLNILPMRAWVKLNLDS